MIELFQRQNLPFSWWVSEVLDTPSNLSEWLKEHGLSFTEEDIVGMYLDIKNHKPVDIPQTIRRLTNREQLKEYTDVGTQIGLSQEAHSKIYSLLPPILYEEGASFEIYVLYDDQGRGVTTGIVLFHANVAGIYFIGTIPSERQQGHGTAMIEFLLNRAYEKGYSIVTLEASEKGKHLYQQLGFQQCCRFFEYIPKNPSSSTT